MHRWVVETLETCLRANARAQGIGRFPDPYRYFDGGGVEEARARCREANADLVAFLRPPEDGPAPSGVLVQELPRRRGLRMREIRFPSPLPGGRTVSDVVQVRVLEDPAAGTVEPRRPVVLFHHPVYQKSLAPWIWFLEPLARRVAVAAVSAPHHFDRIEPGELPSESSLNPNPWRLFESIRQWCHEQPVVCRVLREHLGLHPCGVIGYSFGAFQSILLATTGALPFPMATIASTSRYAWGVLHGVIGSGLREGMREVGIDADLLWEMTDSLQLDRWAPRLRDRPVLYVRGRWDRVDPPPSLDRLEAALRPVRSLELRGGHASLLLQRRTIQSELISFFRDTAGTPG
jgi:hypothetical protein